MFKLIFKRNSDSTSPGKKITLPPRIILIISGIILVVGLIASSVFFYFRYKQEVSKNPNREISAIVATISEFMFLPNETPTLATITNVDELAENALFDRAENGDKVLIYSAAKKAILFRPSEDKVIEVLPIYSTAESSTLSPSPTPILLESKLVEKAVAEEVSIALYNGSSIVGITTKAERALNSGFSNLKIVLKDTTQSRYEQNIVVNLSGDNESLVNDLANEFDAQIIDLPEGEREPNADLLIIIGEKYSTGS